MIEKEKEIWNDRSGMKARLEKRYQALQEQLKEVGPLSQGSVASYPPNSWRWTFKLKGKTACVALSAEQAQAMEKAIENHRKVEAIIREMREITQTLILETIPGGRRNKPLSDIPRAG